ncbi:hypothetical protein F2Q68_00014187 [Brassica cretica]|uniref:Metallo-beta-lactamase domain-containing protein n=1 Tax=Brassica cretica TaxID=69181 RepID=A0A8S9HIM9_BRACR|nr:hypothetical protein F2Q68_00014187 [Brassica cretica]
MVVPMRSRTLKPFTTTNLVVFAPENVSVDYKETGFVTRGDALIVDPGCHYKLHTELKKIVDVLPRKLIVFVTHHHRDHIGGLSAIQESNPDAILVAHVKTRNRIDGWSGKYTPVSGGENIYVNGQRLTFIFAPGHTDGHMALLHNSTRSLIVGDHCVGKGSAFLDIRSGGNMTEYFQTTYKFLELSPHVVIPMHGRVNLWPKHMLCGYLKNRRSREESILMATEDGAQTLFDIVSNVYSKVDRSFWLAAASNVRLHIDNLAVENKLPEGFSIQKFRASCGFSFKLLANLGIEFSDVGEWSFERYVVEPEFGPDSCVRTCFLAGKLMDTDKSLQDNCKWMSIEACFDCLVDAKPCSDRVGPLVLLGLGDGSMKQKLAPSLPVQEYPPGVMVVPMRSRTLKPFTTTNLVVFAPENVSVDYKETGFVTRGDALIVDPGCHYKLHTELKKIVDALPRKLIVLVTHHHRDHIGGLSAIQESNPDAVLVAHVKTKNRIDGWSDNYTPVSGGENIYVNGQSLTVIFAPGHTDGHMALLHNPTRSLIVGDHCVGKGSAFLDIRSGGNMTEYFQTTYKFLDLSPHVVIPMHGRVNLWPKHMLCGYLKNRRSREESILKATEDGAQTLFDIVSNVYSKVDRSFWLAAASNVRLHIDNLAVENKLPEGFSIQKFRASCGFSFKVRWAAGFTGSRIPFKINKRGLIMSVIAAGAGYFLLLACKKKNTIES